MNKSQKGFTLIELIVVLVVLAILAAVAVPKFLDMRQEALTAAATGVAGSVTAAFAANYAAFLANSSYAGVVSITGFSATNVSAEVGSLVTLPSGYSASISSAPFACDAGGTTTAAVYATKQNTTGTATATLICTS